MSKPQVRICSWCQKINSPQFVQYANGIDQKIKDELKEVDQQVQSNNDKFEFTHGTCEQHLIQTYKEYEFTDDEIKPIIQKHKSDNIACLIENEPLRHAYMKGLFTPELQQQFLNSEKQSNTDFKEHFQKLAGIKI